MPSNVTGAGVELTYEERGTGRAVLLIHDMAGDRGSALHGGAALVGDARVIDYARRGYAGSGAPEPYDGTTVHEQAEDAAAVLASLAPQGAVVAGEGFGALIALDLLLRHRPRVTAALLLDPQLLAFVPSATRALADERERIEAALRAGGPQAGVDAWLDAREDRDGEAARASAHGFFADYAGLASWPVTRGELRSLDAPAIVLTHERTPAHIAAAADALAELLPRAERRADGDVAGALRALLDAR